MILFSILVRARPWDLLFDNLLIQSWLLALENCRWFQILSLLFFLVFFLNLLYDIVVFELLFGYFINNLFEPLLSHSEAWFFYDQVRVLLLLFNDFCGDIKVIDVISGGGWIRVRVDEALPIGSGFENSIGRLLIDDGFGIIRARARLLTGHKIFLLAPGFGRAELSSIASLDFVN